MDEITIECDFPPSVNESLAVVRGRLIKTSKARNFHKKVLKDFSNQKELLNLTKKRLNALIKSGYVLRVDTEFVWPYDKVFTKGSKAKHKVKKIDAHNRIKQLHDAISDALEIDDMYFFSGDAVKVASKSITFPYCIIKITKHFPKVVE